MITFIAGIGIGLCIIGINALITLYILEAKGYGKEHTETESNAREKGKASITGKQS